MAGKKGIKHFGESIIGEVLKLKSEGKTNREISEHYGFPSPEIIKELLKRYNRKQRKLALGILPQKKGRPRKSDLMTKENKENKDYIINQLQMQNELLRSFLLETGRR